MSEKEFADTELSISVLSPPQRVDFAGEQELLGTLRPGTDGLTIMTGALRATFLPAVWDSLPEARSFLAHLKKKAGISANQQIEQAWRYSTESFSRLPA